MPRPHKGLPTLLAAWRLMKSSDATLRVVIASADPAGELAGLLDGLEHIDLSGAMPFDQVPTLLAEASVVVIPQLNARGALGQLPARMLEAMAAARPIVATDVCDASRWLADGAGVVVTPGSAPDLAAGIEYVLDHPDEAAAMGRRAQQRLVRLGSEPLLSARLCAVVNSAVSGTAMPAVPAFSQAAERA